MYTTIYLFIKNKYIIQFFSFNLSIALLCMSYEFLVINITCIAYYLLLVSVRYTSCILQCEVHFEEILNIL